MSSEQDDGGPAFPIVETDLILGTRIDTGVTLRDYFAAKAMQAMLSLEDVHLNWGESQLAKWSYEQADAMLEERNKK